MTLLLKREGLALWVMLALCGLVNVANLMRALPGDSTGRDFRQLYAAGYMVRAGLAGELYDVNAQRFVQRDLFRKGSSGDIYFIRPAYEALVFAPLSFLSYRSAYFVFLTVNVALIFFLAAMLSPFSLFRPLHVVIIILAFLPVSVALFQGQDSIVLAVLVAACGKFLDGKRPLLAGVLAGLGLFKLQVLLPIFLLFIAWKRWRFSLGFALSTLGLILSSILLAGIHETWLYLRLVAHVSDQQNTCSYLMPNLRGLLGAIPGNGSGSAVILVHLIVAGLIAIFLPKPRRDRDALVLSISAALLCSYYLFIHDWSLLLLPIVAVLASKQSTRVAFGIALALLLLPDVVPGSHFNLLALPLSVALVVLAFQQFRGDSTSEEPRGETSAREVVAVG